MMEYWKGTHIPYNNLGNGEDTVFIQIHPAIRQKRMDYNQSEREGFLELVIHPGWDDEVIIGKFLAVYPDDPSQGYREYVTMIDSPSIDDFACKMPV